MIGLIILKVEINLHKLINLIFILICFWNTWKFDRFRYQFSIYTVIFNLGTTKLRLFLSNSIQSLRKEIFLASGGF